MNIFKWFQKSPPEEKPEEPEETSSKWYSEPNIDAVIVYYVTKDGETCVDVEINDYEDGTMENFYELLSTVGQDGIFVETLEIVRQGFVKSGREDIFLKLATKVSLEFLQDSPEEPCLKPSDVL
jgi:hypothetical protein